jgi:hypothetical protein
MTTQDPSRTDPEHLTDTELEAELTLAALSSRRAQRFDALLRERDRRPKRPRHRRVSLARRIARSFATRTDAD